MARKQADHLCPPWIGYLLLVNPLRRLHHTAESVLSPHVKAGMTVLEPGPGMGFFTLEAARLVGPSGRVIAVDLQPRMLEVLRRRVQRAGLLDRLETRLAEERDLRIQDLKGNVDFALVLAMAHEVPEPSRFFAQVSAALKPGGRMLLSEPAWHVAEKHFASLRAQAQEAGLQTESLPVIRFNRSVLLVKTP
jgi:cyclopropane fatty-acyl-phospholipid synthase-like methyltransferase